MPSLSGHVRLDGVGFRYSPEGAPVLFGESEPDLERVTWAAKAANAHDFVVRLPLGCETPVEETGLQPSGGAAAREVADRVEWRHPR